MFTVEGHCPTLTETIKVGLLQGTPCFRSSCGSSDTWLQCTWVVEVVAVVVEVVVVECMRIQWKVEQEDNNNQSQYLTSLTRLERGILLISCTIKLSMHVKRLWH